MRKVIGIGETILDIIFRGDQPSAAVPGGSVFNGIAVLLLIPHSRRYQKENSKRAGRPL